MRVCIMTALFRIWMNLASAIEIQPNPSYPLVSKSVTLLVVGVDGIIRSFAWYNGTNIWTQNLILTYSLRNNPPQTPGNQYFSRAIGFRNGSLHIANLISTDQGMYTVEVLTQNTLERASVNLLIYDFVTKPVVMASSCYTLENEGFTLTCKTTNAEMILWGRGSSGLPLSATLSADNHTVTFSNIQSSDGGEYWCEANNPVSKSTSDTYILTVTCTCKSQTSCEAVIAGIICGTILGTILTIVVALLLYKNYANTVGRVSSTHTETVSNAETQAPPMLYYNMQVVDMTTDQVTTGESSYMDLQCKTQDTYEELQK